MKQGSRLVFAAASLALAASAHAAGVSSYAVGKGRLYSQTSAGAPVAQPQPYAFRATVDGNLAAIIDANVQPPSAFGGPMEIPENDTSTRRELNFPLDSLNTMAIVFPDGNYTFTIDTDDGDFSIATLTLTGTAFPTAIPQISNFTAAQSVTANAAFTLNWNALGDATGWGLIITGPDGEVFAETGTGTSVTIPASTFAGDSTYQARLRFIKEVDRETGAVEGAVGTAELFNETEFTIETGQGGGGGGDTTPPILFSTTPVNNATSVGINSTITFNFSEEMAPTHAIEWSSNLNPNSFTYNWTSGGRSLVATYNGNLPANATITWRLNPNPANASNFRDAAGNVLPPTFYQGTFTTGGGTTDPNDPCNPNPVDDGRGFGMVSKSLYYVQTGNNAPVPDAETPAIFSGTYRGASNQTVTAVSVTGPAGTKNFQNLFGFYLLNEEYASGTALETGAPAGNYTFNATGAGSATVALGTTANIPVPRINNLVELGAANVTAPFTLNFAPFTGAGPNDSIFISISEESGQGEFHAPDPCKNILLPNTATSIVIPANTFKTGINYRGSISFTRSGGFNTNTIHSTSVSANAMVTTEFGFRTSGGGNQPTAPRWSEIRRNANGTISFILTAETGRQLTVESTTTFNTWTTVATATVANGTYELIVTPSQASRAIYRARLQ